MLFLLSKEIICKYFLFKKNNFFIVFFMNLFVYFLFVNVSLIFCNYIFEFTFFLLFYFNFRRLLFYVIVLYCIVRTILKIKYTNKHNQQCKSIQNINYIQQYKYKNKINENTEEDVVSLIR